MTCCLALFSAAVALQRHVLPLQRTSAAPPARRLGVCYLVDEDKDAWDRVPSLSGSQQGGVPEAAVIGAYYAVGCAAYNALEGWSPLDSTYFLTLSITTVGYGDICPATAAGRAFTSVYVLLGIFGAFNTLSTLFSSGPLSRVGGWQEGVVERIGTLLGQKWLVQKIDTLDPTLSLEEVNASINYRRRYLLCLVGPLLLFAAGTVLGIAVEGFPTLVDGVYWSIATMTTIGYGDLGAHADSTLHVHVHVQSMSMW